MSNYQDLYDDWEDDRSRFCNCKFCDKPIHFIQTIDLKFVPCEVDVTSVENMNPGEKYINLDGITACGLLADENAEWSQRHVCENYKGPSKGKRVVQEEAARQKKKVWGR